MLLGIADVRAAMRDHRTYSYEPQVLRPMLPRPPVPALETDPPSHEEWRVLFNCAVTPEAVGRMEPVVRADTSRHISAFAGGAARTSSRS